MIYPCSPGSAIELGEPPVITSSFKLTKMKRPHAFCATRPNPLTDERCHARTGLQRSNRCVSLETATKCLPPVPPGDPGGHALATSLRLRFLHGKEAGARTIHFRRKTPGVSFNARGKFRSCALAGGTKIVGTGAPEARNYAVTTPLRF